MVNVSLMKSGEETDIYNLIIRVFDEYVAPAYSPSGIDKFLGMLSAKGLQEMSVGPDSFVLVAKENTEIVGMLSVVNRTHIALIFTDSKYQGRGIGKKLIDECISICKDKDDTLAEVTVSSSPNSRTFYEGIGFVATGEVIDEGGMRFIPMKKSI